MSHETPAEQIDREMTRLHDLTQHMVNLLGAIQHVLDRDRLLVKPSRDFIGLVLSLRDAFQIALPLAKKHRQHLADLRQGRMVTVAGITAPSQTEAIVIHAARMLRHIAAHIPGDSEITRSDICIAGTEAGMDPTKN